MGLPELRRAAARILTDPPYRRKIFSPEPGPPEDLGLAPEELAALRKLDPSRLDVAAEGYAGKRFERVASSFPRTLALLDALVPDARRDYLARTAFAHTEEEERRTFRRHVAGFPDDLGRLLEDAADFDLALLAWAPDAQRPRALVLDARGALDERLADLALPYPSAPRRLLVAKRGATPLLTPLADARAAALCDGTRTLAELDAAGCGATVRAWRDAGLV